jgi:hypothetical protein
MGGNPEGRLFKFGPALHEHRAGDPDCPGCRWDRPGPCDCGGTVHIEYCDSPDQPFMYLCDGCSDGPSRRKPRGIDYEI